jgi:predicted GH43/DUF377 family glycosyl hydrolase
MIRHFPDRKNRLIKITNWYNCSLLDYKGNTYFAYRMDGPPFCTRMKIGLCLVDEHLQPITATNKVLELVTRRRPFDDNYHAEDPRLFIHNDELYLSYVDGYQMAQAKINPETLTATESFYIDKPDASKTEKNWTFFSHEGKLYSIYNTCPHTIFEMNGFTWNQVYQTPFDHNWKYGELRGGTSPIPYGENYLCFFHSALTLPQIKEGRQYFCGAYIFEGKPPFRPLYISKQPFFCGEYTNNAARLSNKIYVVFPSGVVKRNDSFFVSFGYNDLESRYVEIPEQMLLNNLTEIIYQKEAVAA